MKFSNDNQRKAMFANLNKFSSDNRFAKQVRDARSYSGDMMKPGHKELVWTEPEFDPQFGVMTPAVKFEDTSKYYYQEPVTLPGKKYVLDPETKTGHYELEYMNKAPTKMERKYKDGLWVEVPKYETDYYNNDIILALEEESGKTIEQLIDDGAITPLKIEDLSEKLKSKLLEKFDNNDFDSMKKRVAKGEEPEFTDGVGGNSIKVDIVSESDLYNDAYDIVREYIKERGFKKRDPTDWGNEDEPENSDAMVSKGGFSPRVNKHNGRFSLSDAGAKRHDMLMAELGRKREEGVPLADLRKEFIAGMEDFTIKKNPGEDFDDYIKRSKDEDKLIEQEADYLSRNLRLRRYK